jgi:hypothetical protein
MHSLIKNKYLQRIKPTGQGLHLKKSIYRILKPLEPQETSPALLHNLAIAGLKIFVWN